MDKVHDITSIIAQIADERLVANEKAKLLLTPPVGNYYMTNGAQFFFETSNIT